MTSQFLICFLGFTILNGVVTFTPDECDFIINDDLQKISTVFGFIAREFVIALGLVVIFRFLIP